MQKRTACLIVTGLLLAIAWLLPPAYQSLRGWCPVRPTAMRTANAVPAFARKYGVSCSQCHVAFPTLNDFGRQFKLDGYVWKEKGKEGVLESDDKGLWTEKNFPLSAVIRGRPYDKGKNNREFLLQPLRDVDMFMAGGDAAHHVSWFGELEGVTDNNNGMAIAVGDAQLGYHYSEYLNLVAARRGFFVMDPYQSLSNFGSPTVAPRAIAGALADQGGLSLDTMDENKQTASMYGEIGKEGLGGLYYAAGVTADKGQDQGNGHKDGNLRLAFDNYHGLMLGTFLSYGHEGPNAASPEPQDYVKFLKTGLDTMVEAGGFVGRGAFVVARDQMRQDLNALGTIPAGLTAANVPPRVTQNRALYAELMYIYNRGDDKYPFLVPLIRENWYQTMAPNLVTGYSRATFNYVTLQLAHYFRSNVKAFIEWSADTKQDIQTGNPAGRNGYALRSPKNSRWLAQFEVGL